MGAPWPGLQPLNSRLVGAERIFEAAAGHGSVLVSALDRISTSTT
jgi:hypothetical protein